MQLARLRNPRVDVDFTTAPVFGRTKRGSRSAKVSVMSAAPTRTVVSSYLRQVVGIPQERRTLPRPAGRSLLPRAG